MAINISDEDFDEIFKRENTSKPRWQPIETAPKDEWILAYQPNRSYGGKTFTGGHCYVCKWAYKNQFWYEKTSNTLDEPPQKEKIVTYFTCTPTHWMPLPEPPKETE